MSETKLKYPEFWERMEKALEEANKLPAWLKGTRENKRTPTHCACPIEHWQDVRPGKKCYVCGGLQ